jgi:hypothetical protein
MLAHLLDAVGKVSDLCRRQTVQVAKGLQVLNQRLRTAWLIGGDASAGVLQDDPGQLRVIDLRRIEGQGDRGGQFAQIGVILLQRPQRCQLAGGDGKGHAVLLFS